MAHRGRLTRQEFARVFADGGRLQHRLITIRKLPAPPEGSGARWGIAVGKRLAPSSVERNRLRRRIAAAIRGVEHAPAAWLVVQLKPEGRGASVQELQDAIERVLRRDGRKACSGG